MTARAEFLAYEPGCARCPVMVVAKPPYSRLATAVHEAGHAVVARHFGVPATTARVFDRPDEALIAGQIVIDPCCAPIGAFSDSDTEFSDEDLRVGSLNAASLFLAGMQAQLLLDGVEFPCAVDFNDEDTQRAREVLVERFGNDGALWHCQRMARQVLRSRWGEVEQLASRLLEEGVVAL